MAQQLLRIFDKQILIYSESSYLHSLVEKNYSAFAIQITDTSPCCLTYELKVNDSLSEFEIIRNDSISLKSQDVGMFVYQLEKDMTIELEKLCSSLFFMHGAALEKNGQVLVLTGRSGAGKSTTTWGLLNSGFNYLSDELAPINLESMEVTPYPHAVCLKKHPPLYPLPENTLKTKRTMHVPVESLPSFTCLESFPLTKILIVEFSEQNMEPGLTKLSQAEACMHIYTNGLNQLAHDNDGLAAASKIAAHCECCRLDAAQLDKTCEIIENLFQV